MQPSANARPAATAATCQLDLGGQPVAYRRIGAGPPILLANRMRGTLDTWDPLFLDALGAHHELIPFDYPGIGYSGGRQIDDIGDAAAFVDAFATALALDRFVMLGWSWGGAVAQAVLLDHPARVSHAVIVAANPPGALDIAIAPAFIERALKPVNDLADEEVLFFEPGSETSRRAAAASRARIHTRPGVTERIPAAMTQIQPYLKAAAGYHEDAPGRRQRLSTATTPMLVLCGDHDISTAAGNWFALSGRMPSAQLLVLPDTGHAPHHQYPELSARYIAAFLAPSARSER